MSGTHFTVGRYVGSMGDSNRDGEPVVLDASRADVGSDGVTRLPVVSHRCVLEDCRGEMLWDDGYQVDADGDAGAACSKCGSTFNTEQRPQADDSAAVSLLRKLVDRGPFINDDTADCLTCIHGGASDRKPHDPDCLWVQAALLLGDSRDQLNVRSEV